MGKFLFLWGSHVQMPETIPVASPLKDRLLGIPKFEWYSRTNDVGCIWSMGQFWWLVVFSHSPGPTEIVPKWNHGNHGFGIGSVHCDWASHNRGWFIVGGRLMDLKICWFNWVLRYTKCPHSSCVPWSKKCISKIMGIRMMGTVCNWPIFPESLGHPPWWLWLKYPPCTPYMPLSYLMLRREFTGFAASPGRVVHEFPISDLKWGFVTRHFISQHSCSNIVFISYLSHQLYCNPKKTGKLEIYLSEYYGCEILQLKTVKFIQLF